MSALSCSAISYELGTTCGELSITYIVQESLNARVFFYKYNL